MFSILKMKQLTIICLLIPYFVCSQNINGKIYDEDSTVKGALIINLTQNDTTYSDVKGNFKLSAKVNDSLMFRSLFHHIKKVRITKEHFNNVMVFELKKRVNELNEVLLTNEKKKPFNPIVYGEALGFSIAENIKKTPHLYTPRGAYSGSVDFVKLVKSIGINKLFKKKKESIKHIKYYQIDSLFSNSKLFNDSLLINDLKIIKEHKYLFFEYCEAQGLNNELLSVKENIILLDTIFNFGDRFLKFIKEDDILSTSDNK